MGDAKTPSAYLLVGQPGEPSQGECSVGQSSSRNSLEDAEGHQYLEFWEEKTSCLRLGRNQIAPNIPAF